jgi:hypothetical protein
MATAPAGAAAAQVPFPGLRRAAVLLKVYAHCIDGQADAANRRITKASAASRTGPC